MINYPDKYRLTPERWLSGASSQLQANFKPASSGDQAVIQANFKHKTKQDKNKTRLKQDKTKTRQEI